MVIQLFSGLSITSTQLRNVPAIFICHVLLFNQYMSTVVEKENKLRVSLHSTLRAVIIDALLMQFLSSNACEGLGEHSL